MDTHIFFNRLLLSLTVVFNIDILVLLASRLNKQRHEERTEWHLVILIDPKKLRKDKTGVDYWETDAINQF